MSRTFRRCLVVSSWLISLSLLQAIALGQEASAVIAGKELARIVPTSFYFQGQSGLTQMRNAAAARLGANRLVIAGMVDTSGYANDVRARYEGFLITDSAVSVGGQSLGTGAYGFGFSSDGKLTVFDISGKELLSVAAASDKGLRRPRPLMMTKGSDGIRLYSGRNYVVIAAQ
ncbi:MAG TPA: hypothetical protein VJ464_29165 [Blastocatellia bacterium]|nr:hypothetical protein [Blastocatellia bacterium]